MHLCPVSTPHQANVEGNQCDRCRPGTFGLGTAPAAGCSGCFCSGVSQQCSVAQLYRSQLPMSVLDSQHGITLSNRSAPQLIKQVSTAASQTGHHRSSLSNRSPPQPLKQVSTAASQTGQHRSSLSDRSAPRPLKQMSAAAASQSGQHRSSSLSNRSEPQQPLKQVRTAEAASQTGQHRSSLSNRSAPQHDPFERAIICR